MRQLSLLAVLLLLPASTLQPQSAPDAFARMYVAAISDGDLAFVTNVTDSSVTAQPSPAFAPLVSQLRDSLRAFASTQPEPLIDTTEAPALGGRVTSLTYRAIRGSDTALTEIDVLTRDGTMSVVGLHWHRVIAVVATPFRWRDGSVLGRLALGIAVLLAAGSLTAAIIVWRTAMPHRIWWGLLALLGAETVSVAWSGRGIEMALASVQLLCAGVVRFGDTGPWIVRFAFPVGAILALARRHSYQRHAIPTATAGAASDPAPAP